MKIKFWQQLKSKPFGFKYRKTIHYTLLFGVILLQIFLFITVYNVIYNEPKVKKLESELHISEKAKYFSNLTKDHLFSAQENLHNFIITNDNNYLEAYNCALKNLIKSLQKFIETSNSSDLFKLYIDKNNHANLTIDIFNKKFDSLKGVNYTPKTFVQPELIKLKALTYDDILDSVNIETITSVDSIKRKGLFSRVSNAIAGKVDIQREKSNVILTLQKGKIISTGGIEEQLEFLFKNANEYYQKEFADFKKNVIAQQNVNTNLNTNYFEKNKDLLKYSNVLINTYNDALNSYTEDARERFQQQYEHNKRLRNISTVGIVILIIIISIALVFVTNLTFSYEKRLLKARKKIKDNLKFKDRIMRMISHEIRSPLNIISIYSRSVRKKIEDLDLQESLKTIEFTTQNLSLLANQILDFSKNEHNKLFLNRSSINLKYQIDEILKSLVSFTESKNNTLHITSNLLEDTMVFTDVVKIHQLLYNLIGNSNKFTTNGVIQVDVLYKKHSSKQESLTVTIKDNGVGISEQDLVHVFENHFQGDNRIEISNIGAGLGLNLCKEIVELFSGEITISSKINTETIVTFKLYL